MAGMFAHAYAFNGNISRWNTSNVTTMEGMFFNARSFNGNISGWDTSNVTTMMIRSMFNGCPIEANNKPPKYR